MSFDTCLCIQEKSGMVLLKYTPDVHPTQNGSKLKLAGLIRRNRDVEGYAEEYVGREAQKMSKHGVTEKSPEQSAASHPNLVSTLYKERVWSLSIRRGTVFTSANFPPSKSRFQLKTLSSNVRAFLFCFHIIFKDILPNSTFWD